MSLYNDASLAMIPSAVKDGKLYSIRPTDGSGDFTFSRGSNLAATRVDVNGLIEKGRENLFTNSNNLIDVTPDGLTRTTGHAAPFGGTNAALFTENIATSTHRFYIFNIPSSDAVHTYSVYAKPNGRDRFQIVADGGGINAQWNISTGTLIGDSNDITSKIESVGDGWYRLSLTYYGAGWIGGYFFNDSGSNSYTGDGVSGVYLYGAQVEVGLVATDYIETTTTTAVSGITEDLPRLDYSGGASCPSLLLEPQRTNLILHSEYTDGTNWSNEGSITDEENTSETTSPEGVYNAVKLVSANATSEQWIQATGISVTSGNDYTISCFVKKSDYDYFHIRFTGIGSAFVAGSVWFNIAEGSVGTIQSGTGIVADIEDYGNGWYRIWATKEATATAFAGVRFQLASSDNVSSVVGNGSKGTYVYGFQAELGSYPSSYIPTYGSAVTRSQDVCKISDANAIIDNTSMTLFAEMNYDTANTNTTILSIIRKSSGGLYGDFISFVMRNDSEFQIEVRSNNTAQATIRSSSISSGNHKIAAVLSNNNVKLFIDGVLVGSDTSVTLPTGLNEIYLNGYPDSSARYGTKKQYLYFPTALTDSECIALTS